MEEAREMLVRHGSLMRDRPGGFGMFGPNSGRSEWYGFSQNGQNDGN